MYLENITFLIISVYFEARILKLTAALMFNININL